MDNQKVRQEAERVHQEEKKRAEKNGDDEVKTALRTGSRVLGGLAQKGAFGGPATAGMAAGATILNLVAEII